MIFERKVYDFYRKPFWSTVIFLILQQESFKEIRLS